MSALVKTCLHIEVQLKSPIVAFVRTDLVRRDVTQWVKGHFVSLKVNQILRENDDLPHRQLIDSIRVVGYSGEAVENTFHNIQDVSLDVQAYELYDSEEQRPETHEQSDNDSPSTFKVTDLPSLHLDGLWESYVLAPVFASVINLRRLIFEDDVHENLLRFATRMVTISKCRTLNPNLFSWNHTILLYGPPGTGKSSLSRGLAQKLTIRLGQHFNRGKLIDLSCQSMLSKWFGESGKLVRKAFDSIFTMAEDETSLICVLIDEVETIAGSRQQVSSNNECNDALRATNQLLTCMDQLRYKPNVIIFCTSNLVGAIDSAFLDRVDIKRAIPNPCTRTVYEIFRSCLNELLDGGVLVWDSDTSEQSKLNLPLNMTNISSPNSVSDDRIPSFTEMHVHLWEQPECPARLLWCIAQRAIGLSGRALRKLPMLSLALYTYGEFTTVATALAALNDAVGFYVRDSDSERTFLHPEVRNALG